MLNLGAGKLFVKDVTGKVTEFGISTLQIQLAEALAVPMAKITAGGPGSGRHAMGLHMATDVSNWKKVSGAQGSNPGGVYQHHITGEKFYVKFPQTNPEQSNAEVLADKIYNHLGLPAKESFLAKDATGKLGVGSKIIESSPMSQKDIAEHHHAQNGYVADSYLANWDVFGLGWDNFIKDKQGNAIRVDNGGALNYRAQGKEKPFAKDAVLELTSMRQPDKQGHGVWKGLSQKDERAQAHHLVSSLTLGKIMELADKAGYEGQKKADIVSALVGRRNVIAKKYGFLG